MNAPAKLGFARALLLPAVMMFALPAFGIWFAGHAKRTYDANILAAIDRSIAADRELTEEDRTKARAFYRAVPPSRTCLDDDPELASYRDSLEDTCSDMAQFAWSGRASWAAVAIGLAALLFMLGCAMAAFVSRPAQYASFALGWNVLKIVGALETLLQGALLVWLSFWMTALWTERYFVKLILVAGALAAIAAFNVIRAIFQKPTDRFEVEGELLYEHSSPALWARIQQISAQLGTAPPDHVVAGIDDNFFVTEAEVRAGGHTLNGRTLYVSLSLLRTLERSEADAVLAHEMAHLLGGDTGHSKRLAPLIGRFSHYLEALRVGVVTLPIYYFMRAYYAAFHLAVGKSRRRAELAADAVAAKVTSPLDIARSLVKIAAYSSYRARVEESLFERDEAAQEIAIAARVASGFTSYARTKDLDEDLHSGITPHPFDSHPPLRERMANVGGALEPKDFEALLLEPTATSWVEAIGDAAGIEARLWTAYEARFAEAHDVALAYRYEPANDKERAHVEKHFPPLRFEGDVPVTLSYAGVRAADWDAQLDFASIASAKVEERMFKKYLDLKLKGGGWFKGKRSVSLGRLDTPDAFLADFGRYWSRHQVMAKHRAGIKRG